MTIEDIPATVAAGILGGTISLFIKGWFDAWRNQRILKAEARDPLRNIIRPKADEVEWRVNPFWIEFFDEIPTVRGWYDFRIIQRAYIECSRGGSVDGNVPLAEETVNYARTHKEWLIFEQSKGISGSDDILIYASTEPCKHNEAHCFAPLKRIKLANKA